MKTSLFALLFSMFAVPVLAGGAPTIKIRTLPTNIRTLRVDAVDPRGLRSLSATQPLTQGVSLDASLDVLPVLSAFNVPETLERGRIETVRSIDILRDVSARNITPDVAFDGGASRKKDLVPGAETLSANPLSRFHAQEKTAVKTLPAPGKTGKAALLAGLLSLLPLQAAAADGDSLAPYGVALAIVALAALGMFLAGAARPDYPWPKKAAWQDDYDAFLARIEAAPGVAEIRQGSYSEDDETYEYLDVYFKDQESLEKAALPGSFFYNLYVQKYVAVNKKLVEPKKKGWWQAPPRGEAIFPGQ